MVLVLMSDVRDRDEQIRVRDARIRELEDELHSPERADWRREAVRGTGIGAICRQTVERVEREAADEVAAPGASDLDARPEECIGRRRIRIR